MTVQTKKWLNSGEPWVWFQAAAVSVSLLMVLGLILLIAINGLSHFWPEALMEAQVQNEQGRSRIIGEIKEREQFTKQSTEEQLSDQNRMLIKVGNRDLNRLDFIWVREHQLEHMHYPAELMTIERREWGNLYGRLIAVYEENHRIASDNKVYTVFQQKIHSSNELVAQIKAIEKNDIGNINYQLEKLRLKDKRLKLDKQLTLQTQALIIEQRFALEEQYKILQQRLQTLNKQLQKYSVIFEVSSGQQIQVQLSNIVLAYQPNTMSIAEKMSLFFYKLWHFIIDDPREANTEGGVFPAIFGTVIMVILMSIMVTPLGVIAGVYLHEYATQGTLTRIIRIAVNNLAGVPSIVYGVFGLGFFVYFLGGSLDALFYPEASPAPVFGTPGLLWASMTLAILTLPVVIVSTEEGLARIPKSIWEGSLALGATKAETLIQTILPMASPAMMTGLILAVARAAGEVAPLMLVGVVKLAPSLAIDGNAPFLHLERKFMHLGFHIYDVGLQSPNIEAARPLVFATALLLVLVIVLLNITAITLRNRLREKYKGLED